MRDTLTERGAELVPDYTAVVDPATLEPIDRIDASARALIAAKISSTRLIDNCELRPCE
jgi:pantothenate synthetase